MRICNLKSCFTLLLLTAIAFVQVADGQELSTTSNRAIRLFEDGNRNFNLRYYDQAKEDLEKAVEVDDKFLEAWMLLADVYKSTGNVDNALDAYDRVIAVDGKKYPEVFFFSGMLYFEKQDYSLAIRRLKKYLNESTVKSARTEDAAFYKSCAEFAANAIKNPVPFSPENIGQGVNTENDEYINAVKADGLTLYFTGRRNSEGADGGDDFYFSSRKSVNDNWQISKKLGPPVNTSGDEGALTISPDGRWLLFAGCHWPGGFGSCDIYAAKLTAGKAGKPQNLGGDINTGAWESQPSISSDGRTIYFSSTRSGGYGNSDIWKSYLQDDGRWSQPENLGDAINTGGSEMAPFIHPDGETLYFSSDRHVGMGGIDLFISKLDSSGNWSVPENLGYPLNTPGDEINMVVDAAGNKGYISAETLGGFGGFDIFEFELYEAIRPLASTYMKGKVVDAETQKPLEAYFSLTDLRTKKEMVRSFSDEVNGSFLVCIPSNREYALNVSSPGYLFYSENISLSGISTDVRPFLINIPLMPIRTGNSIVLRNIFFDTGKYDLKDESLVELGKLTDFLKMNPGVHIEIEGHTDNIGSEEFNQSLSQKRAETVYTYLIRAGIDRQRLSYRGYGFSKPVESNESEAGRAMNRRTEIKIIEVD